MVDAGVVIDKIVIGNAAAGHLGPPETLCRQRLLFNAQIEFGLNFF